MRIAYRLAIAALAVFGAAPAASAQTVVELRGSSTRYRFVDVNHTFSSKLFLDALYIGVPGMNELYLGAGYAWSPSTSFSLTPILYGVAGKENRERGEQETARTRERKEYAARCTRSTIRCAVQLAFGEA